MEVNQLSPTAAPRSLVSYLPSFGASEPAEGEAWFWIVITVSCVPWVAVLAAWLI
jgi:hypothetical protein